MKYFLYLLLALSVVMIGFNTTQVNFDTIFSEENKVALIAILAAFIVLVLMLILLVSKAIEKKQKELNR